ncbi:hypothetical protein V1291_004823 [Nitrobacteraceae bacterium AZCC 1564]
MTPDFDSMNETDVREIIVRPFLKRLGYEHGSQANIRTEVTLKYDKAFLGRKNPKKDPALVGRADYICEAISYGRWAVEVKAPNVQLNQDDVEQAHTYSAHPEISAAFFVLTNGREFRLYATGQLEKPILQWRFEETDKNLMVLTNILSYEAIRKRSETSRPDVNNPLAAGLRSKMKIVGGEVHYGEHHSNHPLFNGAPFKNTVGGVTGVAVERINDGRLKATVRVLSPYQQFAELNRIAGLGDFEFFCSDEYVSTDVNRPSIFQNVVHGHLKPGEETAIIPNGPKVRSPIGFRCVAYTDAIGYLHDGEFVGALSFDYQYEIIKGYRSGFPQLDKLIESSPPTATMEGEGTFKIRLQP